MRVLHVEEASPLFHACVRELRAHLCQQLLQPMLLHSAPLTPPHMAALMPLVVDAMNHRATVKPAPLLKSMQQYVP